jgi:hypothetical protein
MNPPLLMTLKACHTPSSRRHYSTLADEHVMSWLRSAHRCLIASVTVIVDHKARCIHVNDDQQNNGNHDLCITESTVSSHWVPRSRHRPEISLSAVHLRRKRMSGTAAGMNWRK